MACMLSLGVPALQEQVTWTQVASSSWPHALAAQLPWWLPLSIFRVSFLSPPTSNTKDGSLCLQWENVSVSHTHRSVVKATAVSSDDVWQWRVSFSPMLAALICCCFLPLPQFFFQSLFYPHRSCHTLLSSQNFESYELWIVSSELILLLGKRLRPRTCDFPQVAHLLHTEFRAEASFLLLESLFNGNAFSCSP